MNRNNDILTNLEVTYRELQEQLPVATMIDFSIRGRGPSGSESKQGFPSGIPRGEGGGDV